MKLNPDEIASILKNQISGFEETADVEEIGTVIQVGDGIARVYGLERCIALEMLELPHGVTGLALNLEESNVAVVLFGEWQKIREGDTVRRTGNVMSVPVGEQLIGRVVNPLGQPIDGGPAIETSESRALEFKAPGVVDRGGEGLLGLEGPSVRVQHRSASSAEKLTTWLSRSNIGPSDPVPDCGKTWGRTTLGVHNPRNG